MENLLLLGVPILKYIRVNTEIKIEEPGTKLEGDQGEIVSLQDQTSPCSQLIEKFKCIDYVGKDERWAETSP